MKAITLITFTLLGLCLSVSGQSQTLRIYNMGSTRVKRTVALPEVIYYKLQSENKLAKYRGRLINIKDDTLYIERKIPLIIQINFDTPAVYTEKIAWNNMKWIQFRRNLIGSLIYDYLSLYTYVYTAGGTAVMLYTAVEPLYFTNRSFDSDAFFISMGVALGSLPITALVSYIRFNEYRPKLHTLKVN